MMGAKIMEMVLIIFRTIFCGRQLLSAAKLDLLGTGCTNQIIYESQASGSSQVRLSFIPTF